MKYIFCLFAAPPDDKQAIEVGVATAKSLIYLLNPAIRFRFSRSAINCQLNKNLCKQNKQRRGQMSGHN